MLVSGGVHQNHHFNNYVAIAIFSLQDWIPRTLMWMCQQQKFQWLPWLCQSWKSNCHLWCGIPGSWIRHGKILLQKWKFCIWYTDMHMKDWLMYRILHQIGMVTTLGRNWGYFRTTSNHRWKPMAWSSKVDADAAMPAKFKRCYRATMWCWCACRRSIIWVDFTQK